jgi:hypothetical protein
MLKKANVTEAIRGEYFADVHVSETGGQTLLTRKELIEKLSDLAKDRNAISDWVNNWLLDLFDPLEIFDNLNSEMQEVILSNLQEDYVVGNVSSISQEEYEQRKG